MPHAARFVGDRCDAGDDRFCSMKVTAIYVGWRGARTNELGLGQLLSPVGRFLCGKEPCPAEDVLSYIGTTAAMLTLFDRKPVSEAIAPNVIEALQSIEAAINLEKTIPKPDRAKGPYREVDLAPCEHSVLAAYANKASHLDDKCFATTAEGRSHQARMIVFGHSLGGNILITGLHDQLLKLVLRHHPGYRAKDSDGVHYHDEYGDFVPSPLGNLTVLINPAAEAEKWVDIQREVWNRVVMANAESGRFKDYADGQLFFRPDQRPIIVSVTSARDWPPGGVREADCATLMNAEQGSALAKARNEELLRRTRSIDYDWATYDLFPAFRFIFDLLPIRSSATPRARLSAPSIGPQFAMSRSPQDSREDRILFRRLTAALSLHEYRRRANSHYWKSGSAAGATRNRDGTLFFRTPFWHYTRT